MKDEYFITNDQDKGIIVVIGEHNERMNTGSLERAAFHSLSDFELFYNEKIGLGFAYRMGVKKNFEIKGIHVDLLLHFGLPVIENSREPTTVEEALIRRGVQETADSRMRAYSERNPDLTVASAVCPAPYHMVGDLMNLLKGINKANGFSI